MLNLLIDYARNQGLTTEPGFNPKQVRWNIVFSKEGKYLGVNELGDVDKKRNNGQTFLQCPQLSQPEIKRGGSGCRHFLVDNLEVVTLLGDSIDDPKAQAKHAYFVNLLKEAADAVPELANIASALENEAVLVQVCMALEDAGARPTDNATFSVMGREPLFLVNDDVWHDWWRAFREGLATTSSSLQMRCLASGELVEPLRTHPKIRGLADTGGQPSGDVLASFKQDSFRSYDLSQSENASVSEEAAHAYAAALNHLIQHHGRTLAGAKVIHWYAGKEKVVIAPDEDPIEMVNSGLECLLQETDEEQELAVAQQRARELLEAIQSGKRPDLQDYSYYVLILSGAAGRVMVRDWIEGQFGDLLKNTVAWFDDLTIVARDGRGLAKPPRFGAVLGGLVRDLREIPPPLVSKMWRVAVRNESIPETGMARALGRIRIDIIENNPLNHARMGLLRAYFVRQKRGGKSMGVYLDEDHPEPAYHCGRIMAVLADLQYAAQGDVGAGIIQRYYAAASTTPALVLGNLIKLSRFHLAKVSRDSPGLANWFDDQLAQIMAKIDKNIPETLELKKQSLFALGYYQQKANRKSKEKIAKDEKD